MIFGGKGKTDFTVFDLRDTCGDVDLDELIVAEWDRHPNVRGHQLPADGLYPALLQEVLVPLGGNGQ